jgi:cyanate permease
LGNKVYFGWWTVLATGVLSGLGHGFYIYGISVFFKDLAAELNLSRAVTSLASGIGRVQGGITFPLVGWLADRYGPRWIIIFGICVAAIGMSLMSSIDSVWAYYVAWGVLAGGGTSIGLTLAVDKAITDWFIRKRGLAQGVKFALIGVLGVIVLPVVTWLATTYGWRVVCLLWGVLMLAGTPLVWMFVRQNRPEYYGLLPDGARTSPDPNSDVETLVEKGIEYASSLQETEFTVKQAMGTRAYWLLVAAFGVQTIIMGGISLHIVPFLTDIGIETTAASGMVGMMVFFTIPSRLFGGLLADRVTKRRMALLLAGAFWLQVLGISAFLLGRSIPTVYVLLALYGFGNGAITPLYLVIMGRYFGRKSFGKITGSGMVFQAPLSLVAPVYAGWVYDTTGSYVAAFSLFAVLAAFAAIATSLARAPRLS